MKIIKIIMILFVLIFVSSQDILATSQDNKFTIGEILDTGSDWTNTGSEHVYITMDTQVLLDTSESLYNTLLVVAIGVAIVVGAILGISYMTAGISKKADIKESLFPYIVSCIIVFGSFGIWKLAVTTINSFQPSATTNIITTTSP